VNDRRYESIAEIIVAPYRGYRGHAADYHLLGATGSFCERDVTTLRNECGRGKAREYAHDCRDCRLASGDSGEWVEGHPG
jgi:hypothetical protein